MSGRLVTIFWRDIPAQVVARSGRDKRSVGLSPRFQDAIDRAAQRAGLTSSDDYLGEWRRDDQMCDRDLDGAAKAEAARIEQEYTDDRLSGLVAAGGIDRGASE